MSTERFGIYGWAKFGFSPIDVEPKMGVATVGKIIEALQKFPPDKEFGLDIQLGERKGEYWGFDLSETDEMVFFEIFETKEGSE